MTEWFDQPVKKCDFVFDTLYLSMGMVLYLCMIYIIEANCSLNTLKKTFSQKRIQKKKLFSFEWKKIWNFSSFFYLKWKKEYSASSLCNDLYCIWKLRFQRFRKSMSGPGVLSFSGHTGWSKSQFFWIFWLFFAWSTLYSTCIVPMQ